MSRVNELMHRFPAAERGRIGFKFVDVNTDATIAELDSSKFFTPASNTKLYTTALALARLGPDYKFQTQLATTGSWTQGQPDIPDLRLIGGGDPNLSGRVLPYTPHSVDNDPLGPLKELASKLYATGVRQIDGDVTGVATRYSGDDGYPNGWTVDDTIYSYGAPVTALALNDNSISVAITPTKDGELSELTVQPATSHLIALNEVTTNRSSNTQVNVERLSGSNEIIFSGTIGEAASPWHEELAIDDPALFAAESLIEALEEQNVRVKGVARSEYAFPAEAQNVPDPANAGILTVLAVHDSAPLWQDLQVIHKVSQNLHAEMLLREIGYHAHGTGTFITGEAESKDFLQQIGITREGSGLELYDGSGLARQDLTTPDSTVKLLSYMWNHPEHEVWLRSFPIGGVDGSLEHRFLKIKGADRIHAKTGSITHVNTLSGYIETNRHRWIAFSVMVNATAVPDSQIRAFIDQLCALFLRD